MAKHLSIGSVIEKNKIASEDMFLILMEAYIKDEEGNDVTTLQFVKNSENIVFNGKTYQAANFNIDISNDIGSEPSIKMSAQDQTRTFAQYIEAYGGLVNTKVKMIVVNSGALDAPAEIEETFVVLSASVNEYVVDFDLGVESATNRRFPMYRQMKDRCAWKYKGPRCKYAGPMQTCDFSLFGANGCVAHNNTLRFGGFPAISEGG